MNRNYYVLPLLLALLSLPPVLTAQPVLNCFGLSMGSAYAQPGQIVCLDVTVNGFSNIMGLQGTVQWDPGLLSFSETTNYNLPGMDASEFGIAPSLLDQGRMTFAWFDPNLTGVVRPDGEAIFTLCFEATGSAGDHAEVTFGAEPTAIEVTLADLTQLDNYSFYGGAVGITADGNGPGLPVLSGCIDQLFCSQNTANFQIYPADTPGAFTWTDTGGATVSNSGGLTNAGPGRYDLAYASSSGESLSAFLHLGNLSGFDLAGVEITDANCANSSDGAIDLHLPDTPDFLFSWSNGASSEDLTGLPPGTYSVTITDAISGCVLTESFEVEAADFLVGFSNECLTFNDDSAHVDVTAVVWAGGTPPYTFAWSSGDVTLGNFSSEVTLTHPTTYALTITDANGCQYFSEPQITLCPGFPTSGSVRLFVESQNVTPAQSFCVPVRVDNFEGIASASFSLSWNAGALQFDSITTPDLPADWSYSFNLSGAGDGYLGFLALSSGANPFGYSLPDGSTLFHVCFTAGDQPGVSWLDFGNQPTTMEVANGDGLLPVSPENGAVLITDGASELVLSTPQETAEVGETVCIPVFAGGFLDIGGLQGVLEWDPEVVQLDSLQPMGLDNLNLGNSDFSQQPDIGAGRLRFIWLDQDLQGVSLPGGAPLFTACFTTLAPGYSPVDIISEPIGLLAYRSDLSPVTVLAVNGGITVGDNLVWPGDTDHNGSVDHYDLLNIGLAFGMNGPARPGASLDWTGQPAPTWGMTTPASAVDLRHADTDGNGLVNAADTLALSLNWQQAAGFAGENDQSPTIGFSPTGGELLATGAPLFVQPDTVQAGQTATFPIILGEPQQPAEEVYGLAFSITYDTELVDPNSISVDFSGSWLGEATELLTFYRNDPGNGRLHLALTRTDGLNQNGHGPIATLQMTIEDVIFKSEAFELLLSVEDPVMISYAEDLIPVAPAQTIAVVEDTSTGTGAAAPAPELTVFPVPARRELFLQAPTGTILQVEMLDPAGRTVIQSGPTERLELNRLAGGAYYLRITTPAGVISKRVVIID